MTATPVPEARAKAVITVAAVRPILFMVCSIYEVRCRVLPKATESIIAPFLGAFEEVFLAYCGKSVLGQGCGDYGVFDRFGLSAGHERVYRHLLLVPEARIEELAAASGADVPEVRQSLADLDEAGVVGQRATTPTGHYSLPPEQAFEVLIAREEARLEAQRAALYAARDELPELVNDYVTQRRSGVGSDVEYLIDSPLVRSRIYQLSAAATHSVWSTHPGAAVSEAAVRAALPLERSAAERGLDQRMIVSLESLGPAHWDDYLSTLLTLGHSVRLLPAIPQLCLIFDREHALIPARGADGSTGAYVLHGDSLVAPILALFEELWSTATPFGTTNTPGDGSLPRPACVRWRPFWRRG